MNKLASTRIWRYFIKAYMAQMRYKMKRQINRLNRRKAREQLRHMQEPALPKKLNAWDIL